MFCLVSLFAFYWPVDSYTLYETNFHQCLFVVPLNCYQAMVSTVLHKIIVEQTIISK
jgi:hypothetical protein